MADDLSRRGFLGILGAAVAMPLASFHVPPPAPATLALHPAATKILTGVAIEVNTQGVERDVRVMLDGVEIERLTMRSDERRMVFYHFANGPYRCDDHTLSLVPDQNEPREPASKLYRVDWMIEEVTEPPTAPAAPV